MFSLLKCVLIFVPFWIRFWSILGSQIPPKKLRARPPLLHLESVCFSGYVMHSSKRAQEPSKRRPRGPKTPPRAPQDAPRGPQEHPRRLQESLKRPQEPVKRAQGPPRSPKRLQKTKKALKIFEIDISQTPGPKSQKEKRRAGGGDPPWGSQSAARPVGARPSVLDRQQEL